jgi:site-specific DNA recombinase
LLFDDSGHPMISTHATKNRVRYRYYVSQPHLRGGAISPAGSVSRVSAADIAAVVSKPLAGHLGDRNALTAKDKLTDRALVAASFSRIEVRKSQLAIFLKSSSAEATTDVAQDDDRNKLREGLSSSVLLVPWCKPPSKKFREILLPPSISRREVRLIKAERRAALIKSIARGRAWLDEIVSGKAGVEQIATLHKCSIRHVNMTISLAFLAPALVKAALEGRLPRGIGVASLREAPAQWSHQFERLGLAKPAS